MRLSVWKMISQTVLEPSCFLMAMCTRENSKMARGMVKEPSCLRENGKMMSFMEVSVLMLWKEYATSWRKPIDVCFAIIRANNATYKRYGSAPLIALIFWTYLGSWYHYFTKAVYCTCTLISCKLVIFFSYTCVEMKCKCNFKVWKLMNGVAI